MPFAFYQVLPTQQNTGNLPEAQRVLNMNVFKWTDTLLVQQPDLAGKYFAIDGELIGNQGTLVELPDSIFNLPNNTVVVPDVQTINTAIAGDAALECMGPYGGGGSKY